MKRVRLTIEYDGTAYAGWQRQSNAPSVQQTVEEAMLALTGAPHGIVGASRTDAGVHALGQVAHFDTVSTIPADRWCFALNTRLPEDIRIVSSISAKPNFHARYHATRKRYTYRLYSAAHAKAIGRQYAWHVPFALNEAAMRAAALSIEGTHDFLCCMASGGESKSTVRTVYCTALRREGNDWLFAIEGDGFLYNMVRILVGTLYYIGIGKLEPDSIEKALASGDRLLLGPTAPAHGLCLEWVRYE